MRVQLVVCEADFPVSPIAGNADIEDVVYPSVRLSLLPFAPMTVEALAELGEADQESHLRVVATALSTAVKNVAMASGVDADGAVSAQIRTRV